jgi:hypothetical protein
LVFLNGHDAQDVSRAAFHKQQRGIMYPLSSIRNIHDCLSNASNHKVCRYILCRLECSFAIYQLSNWEASAYSVAVLMDVAFLALPDKTLAADSSLSFLVICNFVPA